MTASAPNDQDVLFRTVFAQHFGELTRLARLLGVDDPDDVAHEAFVRLHRHPLSDRTHAIRRLRATVVHLARKQRARGTCAGLDTLPRRQREVLVLRYGLDLGTTAIAEVLRLSPDTVEAVIHLGLAKLDRETPVERPLRRLAMVAAPLVAALVVLTGVLAAAQLVPPGPPVAAPYRADSTPSRSASSGGDSTSNATSSIPTTNATTS